MGGNDNLHYDPSESFSEKESTMNDSNDNGGSQEQYNEDRDNYLSQQDD